MALQLKKRHTEKCQEENAAAGRTIKRFDSSWTRCKCPWTAEGTIKLDGFIRHSTKETSLERAKAVAALWEERGTMAAKLPDPEPEPEDTHTTIETAKVEFRAGYMEAKGLAKGTRRGYETMLKFLTAYSVKAGLRFMDEFDLGQLQGWQKTWGLNPKSAVKRLELARCFFEFCRKRKFLTEDPTEDVNCPRTGVDQKEPFREDEIPYIMQACREYPSRNVKTEGPRAEALSWLMLDGGLRISDGSFFQTSELDDRDVATYFPEKSNQDRKVRSVSMKLSHHVAEMLRNLEPMAGRYLFTTGKGSSRTVTGVWFKKYQRIFAHAEELMGRPFSSHPHPHRFRHTFAVRMLIEGVAIEDVADMLGHTDPKITRRHYRKWVPGLQDRLNTVADEARAKRAAKTGLRVIKKQA